MKKVFLPAFLFICLSAAAQNKKPLDHSVYDGWKSISERMISNDGKFVVYIVNPQEGDGELFIQNISTEYKKVIARGYNAVITEDSRYVVFKIKPFFQDTRQAKIKKKKTDDMPKDSIGIIELGKDEVVKIARIKGYKTAEKGFGWVAYQLEKTLPDTTRKTKTQAAPDSTKMNIDMLVKLADSIIRKSVESVPAGNLTKEEIIVAANKAAKEIIKKGSDELLVDEFSLKDAEADDATAGAATEGTDLVVRRMTDAKEKTFKLVSEYYFDKKGTKLLIETTKNSKDSNSKAMVIIYNLASEKIDTVMKGFNDGKNFIFDEEGTQLAFVAERDSSTKALQKFYKLWYYNAGQDSAKLVAEKNTVGMKLGFTISENGTLKFSKDGKKLFFGTAPIKPAKDTTLVDFELARLDVWHYNDDYLQPQQLKQLDAELKRSYMAVMKPGDDKIVQLGDEDADRITIVDEGNANWVLAETNKGNRVEGQWTGRTKTTAYIINTADGKRSLILANSLFDFNPSPGGKYVYWYDPVAKNYFTYDVATTSVKNVTANIKLPLYNEENDVPDYANAYGVMGWLEGDSIMYVYDKYDIWRADPAGILKPETLFEQMGRKYNYVIRYIQTNREERFLTTKQDRLYRFFDDKQKQSALVASCYNCQELFKTQLTDDGKINKMLPVAYNNIVKSKNSINYIYSMESYGMSPDLYYGNIIEGDPVKLSNINPQQAAYNWGTAALFKWKTYNGKESEGIVYKPENFDAKKKYPMICYFYEKLADGLYNYNPPSPTPSRLNISFFVSRGYIVFAPDISYTTGHPGEDAYNYIVSGARALVKEGFVDSTKIGLQGQSWGGYQVAYLITRTKLFAAAWAGAPVANMTSAYGGIRWESGINRQFQYEKSQSRIGATLWEKPQLYIENSPLFQFPKVTTPVVIMSNDADGAVPWYQGIEMFTALRRLGKQVWLLQYNGEAHNLVERKNRKDIQIREQQFFDWKLKGEKPAKWLTTGVPATQKGIDWGLGVE